MMPAQIWEAIKFTVIAGGLAAILWYVHRADTNALQLADLKAATKQLTDNAALEAQWRKESSDANAKLSADLAANASAISQQRAPVLVRIPTGSGAVSGHPAAPAGCPAAAGGSDQGARGDIRDVRPELNAFELRFENAFAECRSALDKWPSATKEKPP